MKKVSFDFDGTLSRIDVQKYAKTLLDKGIEVWIVTSRNHEKNAENLQWNDDLYEVAKSLKIPKSQIHFMNWWLTENDKWEFLKDHAFIWHLDDDFTELKKIKRNTKTLGISCFGNTTWKRKCDKLINKEV